MTRAPRDLVRRTAPTKRPEVYDVYWAFASRRHAAFEARLSGGVWPWSDDPILQKFKFCNVFRALDRVSQYLIGEVAYGTDTTTTPLDRIFQLVAFRTFSKIGTWREVSTLLGGVPRLEHLRSGAFEQALDEVKTRTGGLYTGAFILCATKAFGFDDKHRNHVALFRHMFFDNACAERALDASSLEALVALLQSFPLMGPFMAYQTAIDLNYSDLFSFNENDYVQAGPGALRGLRKAFVSLGDYSPSDAIRWMVDQQLDEFARLGLRFDGLFGRPLHAIDCQGLFCELDKYCREAFPGLTSARTRIKARYKPSSDSMAIYLPPKWRLRSGGSMPGLTRNARVCIAHRGLRGMNQRSLDLFERMTTLTPRRTIAELRSELEGFTVDVSDQRPLTLAEYQRFAVKTYRGSAISDEKLEFLLLGLFGEVGSLLSELKKKQRDRSSYIAYNSSSIEETGDVLWYLANVVDHCGLSLGILAGYPVLEAAVRPLLDLQPQASQFHVLASPACVHVSLLDLAGTVGTLVSRYRSIAGTEVMATDLAGILSRLVSASTDAQISLAQAAHANLDKVMDRWPIRRKWAPLLDAKDLPSEQFPRVMQVLFKELRVGRRLYTVQSMNEVNIGDRLTDNSFEEDDYRFHDVFHLAFAGILGWSPVLRSLLSLRRRSRPIFDEVQDGARAKITEEGISNWVFSHGLRHESFEHVDSLDFALLKTIGQMVKGYEAESLMPWMWEHAILEGFRVFRFLRRHRGGLITADLNGRCLSVAVVPSP